MCARHRCEREGEEVRKHHLGGGVAILRSFHSLLRILGKRVCFYKLPGLDYLPSGHVGSSHLNHQATAGPAIVPF